MCANAGPVLVLVLLLYCINFSSLGYHGLVASDSGVKELADESLTIEDQAEDIAVVPEEADAFSEVADEQEADIESASGVGSVSMTGAWTISINDERTVTLANRELAYEVLEEVKKHYCPEGDELEIISVEFVEPVEVFAETVPLASLSAPDQAFAILTEGREKEISYKVVKGDNYWSLARKFGMNQDELKLINNAPNDKLQIGQILRVNWPQPVLSVKTSYTAKIEEKIPFDTEYKSNAAVWESQTKVLKPGVSGVKEVFCEIAQINGIAVERRVLEETVITDPVTCVMEKGTKKIVASRADPSVKGSGLLKWPINGRINSPYGKRGRGNHSGIDIAAKIGDPIYSAAAGTVIAASTYYAYGQRVIIDHGNGLTTWYAHLSEFKVSVGQVVGELELIGLAGRTGRTTGPHLHFEVRVDGQTVNPANYLH